MIKKIIKAKKGAEKKLQGIGKKIRTGFNTLSKTKFKPMNDKGIWSRGKK